MPTGNNQTNNTSNNAARRASFNRRRASLLNRAAELSAACGVDTCAIVYGPDSHVPAIFPPSSRAVAGIVRRFEEVPEEERAENMVDEEMQLRQSVRKAIAELNHLRHRNRMMEAERVMLDSIASPDPAKVLAGLSLEQLKDLGHVIDQNVKEIDEILNLLKI